MNLPQSSIHEIFLLTIYCSLLAIAYGDFILANTDSIGSRKNPLKYKVIPAIAFVGNPVVTLSIDQRVFCAKRCKEHIACRAVTYWQATKSCQMFNRKTQKKNDLIRDRDATSMEFIDEESHVILATAKSLFEIVPETRSVKQIAVQLKAVMNAGTFDLFNGDLILNGKNHITEIRSGFNLQHVLYSENLKWRRYRGCSFQMDSSSYNCFGWNSTSPAHNHCEKFTRAADNNTYMHENMVVNNNWRKYAEACVVKDENVYVISGAASTRFATDSSFPGATSIPAYPVNVIQGAAVWFQGGVVYCGGTKSQICRKYHPTSNTWNYFPPLLSKRVAFGMVKFVSGVEEKIIVVGGFDENSQYLNSVEIYENSQWQVVQMDVPLDLAAPLMLNLDSLE